MQQKIFLERANNLIIFRLSKIVNYKVNQYLDKNYTANL